MYGWGGRLRGADCQAENVAVPFTICEKALLRIFKGDLQLEIINKLNFNDEKMKGGKKINK